MIHFLWGFAAGLVVAALVVTGLVIGAVHSQDDPDEDGRLGQPHKPKVVPPKERP